MPHPTGPIRTDHEAGELVRGRRDDERYWMTYLATAHAVFGGS